MRQDMTILFHTIVGGMVCILNVSFSFLYTSLIAATLLSIISPFLYNLSLHGKVRTTTLERQHSRTISSFSSSSFSWIQKYLVQKWVIEKSYFIHFYKIGLLSLVALCWYSNCNPMRTYSLLLLSIHLCRRYYECLYVHQWRTSSQMHIMGYLAGIAHYLWLPYLFVTTIPCEECLYDLSNKWFSLISTFCPPKITYPVSTTTTTTTTTTLLCCFIFFIGLWAQYQQYRHHIILKHLRATKETSASSRFKETTTTTNTKYGIPTRGWFQMISCPHYLAEIILYGCFHLLISLEYPNHHLIRSYQVLLFVVGNLTVTASRTHRWYCQNHAEYTKLQRYALIPFVF